MKLTAEQNAAVDASMLQHHQEFDGLPDRWWGCYEHGEEYQDSHAVVIACYRFAKYDELDAAYARRDRAERACSECHECHERVVLLSRLRRSGPVLARPAREAQPWEYPTETGTFRGTRNGMVT